MRNCISCYNTKSNTKSCKTINFLTTFWLNLRRTILNFLKIITREPLQSRRYKVAYCLLLALLKRVDYVFSHILARNAIISSAHKSTFPHRIDSTSRRSNVKSSQRRVGHAESSHVESITPKSPAPVTCEWYC